MSSKRKTLIYNWVEEVGPHYKKAVTSFPALQRQCEPLETENRNPDGTLCTNLHRVGHKVGEKNTECIKNAPSFLGPVISKCRVLFNGD